MFVTILLSIFHVMRSAIFEFQFNAPLNSDIDFIILKSYTMYVHTYIYCYSSAALEVDIKSAVVEHTFAGLRALFPACSQLSQYLQ